MFAFPKTCFCQGAGKKAREKDLSAAALVVALEVLVAPVAVFLELHHGQR